MKKDWGAPGIPNIREMNLCLLASWIRRYSLDEDKLWKQIVDFKYGTQNLKVFSCHGIFFFTILERGHVGGKCCKNWVQMGC
jgi:hypothetical protein